MPALRDAVSPCQGSAETTTPHNNDVLFGRGAGIMSHPGNRQLRSMVERQKKAFQKSSKRAEKRRIAADIICKIQGLEPPGRFLTEGPRGVKGEGKIWVPVEPDKALTKVMHSLREKDRQVEARKPRKHSIGQETLKHPLVTSLPPVVKDEPAVTDANISEANIPDTSPVSKFGQEENFDPVSFEAFKHLSKGSNKADPGGRDLNGSSDIDANVCSFLRDFSMRDGNDEAISPGEFTMKQDQLCQAKTFDPISHVVGHDLVGSSDADEIAKSFLHDFSWKNHNDDVRKGELTMKQWINKSKQDTTIGTEVTSLKPAKEKSEYIRRALFVALKVTGWLIAAEKEERNGAANPIPLASIIPAHVVIQIKRHDLKEPSTETKVDEVIEHVRIMSCTCTEDGKGTGTLMQRLSALGAVLYELFSWGEVSLPEVDVMSTDTTLEYPSLKSMKLNNETIDSHSRKKRSRKRSSRSGAAYSECIGRIESLGIPLSLCALIGNLLDCANEDFSSDTAFTSFADVLLELRLMITDPSLYLDDLKTNPMPLLTVPNKLYGRKNEVESVNVSYRKLRDGTCNGVIISGRAGVGKSKLAMHVGELTSRAGGYFVRAKFEQNSHATSLSAVGLVLNELCELFAQDASFSQLISVSEDLSSALSTRAALLVAILPSLKKLMVMPPSSSIESSGGCVDFRLSMAFLLAELLRVISSHSRRISILLDDLQWADPTSLSLLANLISSVQGSTHVFFVCCYRDSGTIDDALFKHWFASIQGSSLTLIKLEDMTVGGVNHLMSETLHLSPRITRPLSSILHHKTTGNTLFLTQLLESLKDRKYIYVKLNQPRWAWNLTKIQDLNISEDVVALLINEMQKLPDELQTGLMVASCMGSCMKYSVLDILSRALKMDLQLILQQITQRGFMNNDRDASLFRFVHDKIRQSAVELMSEQERRRLHTRLGLALQEFRSSESDVPQKNDGSFVPGNARDDEILFAAVNQINQGGPDAHEGTGNCNVLASLNLKAGKRAVALADFNAAFGFFKHGVLFLPNDCWDVNYDLSIQLFDLATEAACITNDRRAVALYSEQLLAHTRCFEEKLNCLYSLTKSLRQANRLQEAMQSSFSVIQQCGEELPLPIGNKKLDNKMQSMNQILQNTEDKSILGMVEASNKKVAILLKLYADLANLLFFVEPSLIGAISLRMIELTLTSGLTSESPLAFAFYAGTLTSMGDQHVNESCRLGRTALKLLEKDECSKYKSSVTCIVYTLTLWASTPLQAVAKEHLAGHQAGMQSGDFLYSHLNKLCQFVDEAIAGQNLSTVRNQLRDFIMKNKRENVQLASGISTLFHLQAVVLQEGQHCLDDEYVDNVPGLKKILEGAEGTVSKGGKMDATVPLLIKIFQIQRACLFRQFDGIQFCDNNLTDFISKEKHPLRPSLLMGIFFQGLASFQLARHSINEAKTKWIEYGESALAKMTCWECPWNFENKILLLEAEKMYISGNFNQAEDLYIRSIRSAHEHKFVQEEAIASEMAGDFFYETHCLPKSLSLFKHSIKCYIEWGALAVARRVESIVQTKFDLDSVQIDSHDNFLAFVQTQHDSSKKRADI